MAKEALSTPDTAWQHVETRAAILAAARKLLDAGGLDSLSLDAVGDATGFAHATIYAYFASRTDMLVSMVCEDVCAFARSIAETFPFSEVVEPEPAPVLPFVAPERAPEPEAAAEPAPEPVAEHELVVEEPVAQEPVAEEPAPEAVDAPSPEELVAESAPPETSSAEPSGEIAEIRQAIAKLEARRVDAWLERRLRVFEKTLSDIETRLTTIETASNRATNLVEENTRRFVEHAETADKRQREASDGVAEKLEGADRKLRGSLAELRAMLNDVYGRLETLEIAKGMAVTPAPPLDAAWEAGETIIPAGEKAAPAEKPLTAAAETYLSAARRAAKTAAELAEIESRNNFLEAATKSWTRTRVILAACIGLGAVMVIAGLFLHYALPAHKEIVRPAAMAVAPPVTHPVVAAKQIRTAAPVKPAPKPDMAFYRVTAAASTGNADAQLLLGLHLMEQGDDAKAALSLQQSANQGNAIAQYWLGTLYERGHGVKADPAAAWRWYQSAAKKGNVKAMYNLAVASAHGSGAKQSLPAASHWFWMAAMQGYVDAQYNLAVLYERGQGVPQSLVNAYKWYAIAAAAGDHDSKSSIEALKTQLKPAELTAGERAAASYKPNPVTASANTPPDPAQLPGG
ncbi:MAG TPA: TetR family transcriptional regulator [Rhizomicrobium sp.]|jgi:TPR repeat protein